MQVKSIAECSKGSILQYFRTSLSYHLSLRSLFCLFLSGRCTQVLNTRLDKGHNKDCCVEDLRGYVRATIGNKSWLVMHLLKDATRNRTNMVFHALTMKDVSTQEEMYVHENLVSSLCE